jgi:hypothetical protein
MERSSREREKCRREALERHERLSRLYKEDRLSFERERKRMIDQVMESVEDESQRDRLKALQEDWNRKMKGAGSHHNRFILAKTFFWKHFHEVWQPTIQEINRALNKKAP